MCRFEFDWPYRIKRISSLIGQVFPCRGRVYRFEAGLVREYIEGKVSIGRVRYLLNIVLFHVGVRITSFPLQFRPIYFLLIPYPLSHTHPASLYRGACRVIFYYYYNKKKLEAGGVRGRLATPRSPSLSTRERGAPGVRIKRPK